MGVSLSNNNFAQGAEKALATTFAAAGPALNDAEKSLFREAGPFGFILFARNCENPQQLYALVQTLKETVGRDCPVLIDQEGGRVQRLRPPHWRDYPTFQSYGELYESQPDEALEDLRFDTLRIAESLTELGINVNCTPVLDLIIEGSHDIIGDRSFSSDPEIAGRLGLSVCRHLLKAGVTPVIKHLPGHGRARADSHLELPVVEADPGDLARLDFSPFKQVSRSDVGSSVWAMTAHIVYPALDQDNPATLSSKIISEVIRGEIGFQGFLVGDDLDMKALDPYGSLSERAIASLKAGCDLALYCKGELKEMEKLAENLPKIGKNALMRLKKASESGNIAA
ncbi:MAG: beta-N-acetylhexosaminidase [Alphaproteobacteria bacterium]|nr:beta-N-acetylhexosaminidase [Alphaproteobacteria bacterium]